MHQGDRRTVCVGVLVEGGKGWGSCTQVHLTTRLSFSCRGSWYGSKVMGLCNLWCTAFVHTVDNLFLRVVE